MKKVLLLSAIVISSGLASLHAQPGNLDMKFGSDGIVRTAFDTGYNIARAIALQPDEKIIVAGVAYTRKSPSISKATLVRYKNDGTVDSSFGTYGRLITDFDLGRQASAIAVALQPDGKIILAGNALSATTFTMATCLARYDADGKPDISFGYKGIVATPMPGGGKLTSIALQADGKIVTAGQISAATINDFALMRYLPDGSPDPAFGGHGMVTTDIDGHNDIANSVAVRPDGLIIAAGFSDSDSHSDFSMVRYLPDGRRDSSFGNKGIVITDVSPYDYGYAMTLQPDGKILIAGTVINSLTGVNFALLRFQPEGEADLSFNGTGIAISDFTTDVDEANAIALQADGKILCAGVSAGDFAIARYMPDGPSDTSFSKDSWLGTDIAGGYDHARCIVIQPNHKIIVAGSVQNRRNGWDFGMIRYWSGLELGVIDFSTLNSDVLLYPNPAQEQAILEYTLEKPELISIDLLDIQGKCIQAFSEKRYHTAGRHKEMLTMPAGLSSGTYFIVLSNGKGRLSIKLQL